jgi:hypothetical protein
MVKWLEHRSAEELPGVASIRRCFQVPADRIDRMTHLPDSLGKPLLRDVKLVSPILNLVGFEQADT